MYFRVATRPSWCRKDTHLLELARYVVLNPVRARLVRSAREWPWSSYRATAAQVPAPPWLTTEWLLSAYSRRKVEAVARYKAFVAQGRNQPSPWESLRNQIYLGSERFVEEQQAKLDATRDLSEVPLVQRRPVAKALAAYTKLHNDRDEAIAVAYASGGYSLKEIGAHFGLHYSRISRIVRSRRKANSKT